METTLHVLLFEKDPTEAELMEMQLRKASLRATVKRTPSLELLLAEASEAPPDLVLANHALPRFDTAETVEGLRRIRPGIPLILYALNGNEETAIECMKAGAADFILKKHMARLGASVKRILERAEAERTAATRTAEAEPRSAETPAESHDEEEEVPSARLFRQIVERAPDLIAVLGLDGRREYNNPAYKDVLEDPDILAGTDSFLDILSEDRDRIRDVFQQTVKQGHGKRTEYRLLDKEGETRYIQSNSGVILNEEGDPEKIVVISRDMTEAVRDRQRFEMLVASTAGLAGEDFFSVLAHRLADTLAVRAVLISRFADDGKTSVRSLGFWADGILQETHTYELAGTPCEKVIASGEILAIPSGVPAAYPRMSPLAGMRVESYLGLPLQGTDGTTLGHLFLADEMPMVNLERIEFVSRVMARRASLELQRMTMTMAVAVPPPSPPPGAGQHGEPGDAARDQDARLRSGMEGLPTPVVMTDEQGVVTFVNARLEELAGREAEDLVGRRAWPLLLSGGPWHVLNEAYEDVVVRPDKTRISVAVYAIPCRDAGGRISGTLGALTRRGEPKVRRPE